MSPCWRSPSCLRMLSKLRVPQLKAMSNLRHWSLRMLSKLRVPQPEGIETLAHACLRMLSKLRVPQLELQQHIAQQGLRMLSKLRVPQQPAELPRLIVGLRMLSKLRVPQRLASASVSGHNSGQSTPRPNLVENPKHSTRLNTSNYYSTQPRVQISSGPPMSSRYSNQAWFIYVQSMNQPSSRCDDAGRQEQRFPIPHFQPDFDRMSVF